MSDDEELNKIIEFLNEVKDEHTLRIGGTSLYEVLTITLQKLQKLNNINKKINDTLQYCTMNKEFLEENNMKGLLDYTRTEAVINILNELRRIE